jgi:hypothetical protein
MKRSGHHDKAFWNIDARDLKRDLRASSIFRFKVKDIKIGIAIESELCTMKSELLN